MSTALVYAGGEAALDQALAAIERCAVADTGVFVRPSR